MKSSIKAVSVACVLTMLMSVFAGCGANKAATASTPQSSSKPKEVSMRFSWWGGDTRHKATIQAIDTYTKNNPNVKIEAEYMAFDGYEKKLITQVSGGTAPDIFQFSATMYPDISQDNFLDLNKYSNVIDLKNFGKTLIEECTYKGKLQGLPAGVLCTTTMYNKNFFKRFNIPEDTVWTWDKLLEVGKKVHDQDKNVYLTTGDLDVINRLFVLPYLSQQTGDIWVKDDYTIAFDKATLTKTLQYLSDMFTSGTMEPLGTTSAFVGKMEQNPKWIKGDIGLNVGLTSGIAGMKAASPNSEFGVTDIPMFKDAKQSANPVRSSVILSINGKSKTPDEAAKFVNWFLNDKEAASILGEQRGTPGSDAARKALSDANKLDPLISKAMELGNKNPGKIPNSITENAEISQINKDVITKIGYGKITPEQGADEIIKGYQSKLKELQDAAGKK